jgi:hypothetical protein
MRLAKTGLFLANWRADAHEEWMSSLLANRPDLSRAHHERTRALMDMHALTRVKNYEDLIEALHLPDPKDRHVLASAIRAKSAVVVTMNLKDFPQGNIAQYGIEGCTRTNSSVIYLMSPPKQWSKPRVCTAPA